MKLFGKKPTVRDQVKSSQRAIGANVRDLERELVTLKRQEQQVIKDIKAAANQNNVVGAKVLAKQLVRVRAQQTKLLTAIASLRGTAASTSTVATSMVNATKAMQAVGQAAKLPEVQKNMQNFAMENSRMGMASEMMDDAIEGALDNDGVEEDTNELVDEVLAGIGIDVAGQMAGVSAPIKRLPAQHHQQQQQAVEDDLIARLEQLK